MKPQDISIEDYDYPLAPRQIALHPPERRDGAKLLIYRDGIISESIFSALAEQLPADSLMVFNDSKVIHARLKFTNEHGGIIEIFCLEPAGTLHEYSSAMNAVGSAEWHCLVGGAAKWKTQHLEKAMLINHKKILLTASKVAASADSFTIRFSWPPLCSFAELIEAAGDVPLPPYIKRSAATEDESRYQTIFARAQGSVAAPTAGLHFTENVFASLRQKNIAQAFVTLHVGAGTFKPVKAAAMIDHEMHAEYIDVRAAAIEKIRAALGSITAVGTTSLRTIETLYLLGVKAIRQPSLTSLGLTQWEVYEDDLSRADVQPAEALEALLAWLKARKLENIFTKTQLLIAPGYRFRVADRLITNFHQPRSTLLLLVAAAIGDDWEKMYRYAAENDFRFLSYGDANLVTIRK